jgi:UDP-2,4-diacetamido-2,4,6-trideoxy-beta-L-altropyranose hydrolase
MAGTESSHSAESYLSEDRIKDRTLLIRADADLNMGTGHVMRCLALAQAWRDAGGLVAFAAAHLPEPLTARLQSERVETISVNAVAGSVKDAAETAAVALERGAEWVVVDGYHFNAEYQKAVKHAGLKLLYVDDNGIQAHYHADLILNQNIHATAALYEKRDAGTQLLLGTKYALLRREFRVFPKQSRPTPEVARRLLVTMGGSDSSNVTGKVLAALDLIDLPGLTVQVVVGGSNTHYEELKSIAGQMHIAVQLLHNVSDMPAIMAQADMAVSAAGSSCWELAFMGVPTVLIVVAPNQLSSAQKLSEAGLMHTIGRGMKWDDSELESAVGELLANHTRRLRMHRQLRELVDGQGVFRAISDMKTI